MSSTILSLYVLLFLVSVLVYQIDSSPIQFRGNNHALQIATYDGVGQVLGPEDIAYDSKSRIIYTGCQDGFIKKVYIGKSNSLHITNVESWVNTRGRPLGVALGRNGELIVADAYKGLLNVSKDGVVELLTDEVEGVKFKFTEGVDVANNGMIYFTDGSYKYNMAELLLALVDNEPRGRFMSFDPVTRETKVLVRDIFFANGVTVSPDQNYVVFCETLKSMCRKYHIRGPKIGLTENFIELPGLPDNIRYDGLGHYWIGIFKDNTTIGVGGIVATDLNGKVLAYYSDFGLSIAGGNIIEDALICGSLLNPYFVKFDLDRL